LAKSSLLKQETRMTFRSTPCTAFILIIHFSSALLSLSSLEWLDWIRTIESSTISFAVLAIKAFGSKISRQSQTCKPIALHTNSTFSFDIILSHRHVQLVSASIKSLEKRALIKSTKSVNNPTKKLYILAHLEPSLDLTGGSWYTDQEFDLEFIDALARQCYKFIYQKVSHASCFSFI
jgi:RNA polymerase Rpc34 subunit